MNRMGAVGAAHDNGGGCMNEGVAEASERMLKGAGAFAHETPYAVGKHYRQINSSPDV